MPQYSGVWTLTAQAQAQSNQQWVTDPNFKNTTLLLQADGAVTGSQNNTFLDFSNNSFAITRNGGNPGMTQGTFTPFSSAPGRWSTYYTGVVDTNATYLASNAAYSFGTGDFTVEAWINIPPISNTNGKVIVDSRPDSTNGAYWIFSLTNNGRLNATTMSTGGVTISSTNPIPTNQWVHVAYTRRSGILNLWVNGLSVATASGNTDNISSSILWIGRLAFSSVAADSWFTGYMSNLRIVKGVAVYTGNFTPQTTPLTATQPSDVNIAAITGSQTSLLMQQSNRFVDNSTLGATVLTNNTWPSIQAFSPFAPQFQWTPAVIGGSGYFDGTGDYLSAPNNATTTIGTSDYTFEGWFYTPAVTALQTLMTYGAGAWRIFFNATTVWFLNSSSGILNVGNVRANEWTHLALVRSGSGTNNTALWINGTRVGQATNTTNFAAGVPQLGMEGTTSAPYTGYMSNIRLVKSALYNPADSAITIPSVPFSNVTNTSFLLNFTNAGIYDGAMKNNLETVGNAQVSTSVVKYGSGSMVFDGTDDRISIPTSPNLDLGFGDFTIECWAFNNNWDTDQNQLFERGRFTVGKSYRAWMKPGQIVFEVNLSGTATGTYTTITATIKNNVFQWYHLAFVRNGSNFSIYRDGVQVASATSTAAVFTTTEALAVGGAADGNNNIMMMGYIDDFRITKGVARYLQNFLPPQVALPRQ